jgi:hypothetical protein
MRENHLDLERFALASYRAEGRGAIVVHPDWSAERGGFHDIGARYVSRGEAARKLGAHGTGGWPDARAEGMVDEYDPSRQFVVIVIETDGLAWPYRCEMAPPPAE